MFSCCWPQFGADSSTLTVQLKTTLIMQCRDLRVPYALHVNLHYMDTFWGGGECVYFFFKCKKKKFDTHIRCQTDKVLRLINKWEAGSHTTAGLFIF